MTDPRTTNLLYLGANLLRVEAQEWRNRAAYLAKRPDWAERDKASMLTIARSLEGMADAMCVHAGELDRDND